MPHIYDLIRKLQPEEKQKIRQIHFQDRELEILDFMMECNKKIFPSSTVCNTLKINNSHLDKINSILLKRSIECLGTNNIYAQISFLNTKNGLWNLSKHLLKIYERKHINHELSKGEIFQFYVFYFEWYLSIPFSHQTKSETLNLRDKLLENNIDENSEETKLWMRALLLRKKILLSFSQVLLTNQNKRDKVENELFYLLDAAQNSTYYKLYAKVKTIAILFYDLIKEFDKSQMHFNDLTFIQKMHYEHFSQEDFLNADLMLAQILYYNSSFTDAYLVYKNAYNHFAGAHPTKWFAANGEFMQLSLIMNDLSTAEKICEGYFSTFLDDVNGYFFMSSYFQIIKFDLFIGKYTSAHDKLIQLKKYISKTSLLQYQFALRELTTAYLYLSGDFSSAEKSAEKNLKFLRFKHMHKLMPEYLYHSKLVKIIIKKDNLDSFTNQETEMLKEMMKGTMVLYGIFIQKLLELKK